MQSTTIRQRALVLLLTTVVVAVAILAVGWFTDARRFAYGALLAVASTALLPLVIVAAGVAITMFLLAISMLGALFGGVPGGGEELGLYVAAEGVKLAPTYYAWLFRVRHPVFWGSVFGLLSGGLLLWAMFATLILPREVETTEGLIALKQRIDVKFAATSRYPAPDDRSWITYEALGDTTRRGPVIDGFGRPYVYKKTGHWKVATYTILSLGRDGAPGGRDDFEIQGGTNLGRFAEVLKNLQAERSKDGRRASIKVTLGALKELRKDD